MPIFLWESFCWISNNIFHTWFSYEGTIYVLHILHWAFFSPRIKPQINIVKVAQSCPTLCNPMDCSLLGISVHGILQAKIMEWAAISFSKGSSQPRDQPQVSSSAGVFFTIWATREAQEYWSGWPIPSPGNLPNLEIEPGSPALQVDSLPAELPVKCPNKYNLY